jgi:deoxyribodipyrimidine photo-lyase
MDAYGIPSFLQQFEPTREAALARVARVSAARYAKSRNHLDGAVTGLSPYVTHGFITAHEALATIAQKHALSFTDKLVQEFAWREFFHHVWSHAGDAIFKDMREPLQSINNINYTQHLPQDIREARTGVPAIDIAVRVLYATGYLHNHARLWLASYCVHWRKVHWRAGADWMYGHLLDGDLASNHLSWQWVAGTFSAKPYLFNADNVARYAPATAAQAWDSKGSVIDVPYETLEHIASSDTALAPLHSAPFGAQEPALSSTGLRSSAHFNASAFDGRSVRLVHPWHTQLYMSTLAHNIQAQNIVSSTEYRIGVIHHSFHQAHPWSDKRWQFVAAKFKAAQCDAVYAGDLHDIASALARAAQVRTQATLNPHYSEVLNKLAVVEPITSWLPQLTEPCASFSKYYEKVQRKATDGLQALLLVAS